MKDLFLVCTVAAVFVFGYFMMKKLDLLLGRSVEKEGGNMGEAVLRLAVEDPLTANAATSMVERFSKKNPNCRINMICATAEEIYEKLACGELDFGFIAGAYSGGEYGCADILLEHSGIFCDIEGMTLEPIELEDIKTAVLWNKDIKNRMSGDFAKIVSSFAEEKGKAGARAV